MKRNLYIQMAMVAAALITAGCSGDDDITDVAANQRAISFTGNMSMENSSVSRAGEEGLEDYSHRFVVFGYKNGESEVVMNGYNVNWVETSAGTTTTNTHDWEYVGQQVSGAQTQVIKYWDETATDYTFFGYVPARTNDKTDPRYYETTFYLPDQTNDNHQIVFRNLSYCAEYNGYYTYLIGYNADKTPIYAEPLGKENIPLLSRICRITDTSKMGEPVKLEFVPPYAKVKIAFQRIDGVDSSPISGITFKPKTGTIPTNATFVCSYFPTTGTTSVRLNYSDTQPAFGNGLVFDALSKTTGVGDAATIEGIMDDPNKIYYANPYYMLFPTVNAPVDFTLSAWIGSGWQECVVPAAYMKWEMGYEYTYVFKITKAGLNLINVIKVGIKTWESIGSTDTELHNW